MGFRILGPLSVLDEGRAIALGGSRQRALLALLLLHANETLSTTRLIDELWGERAPAKAAKTVQMQISRLRRGLGEAGDGSGGLVMTRERGYELRLDPEHVDAHRFRRLVAEGRGVVTRGHPERAVSALEGALSLWYGAPLAEFADAPFAQREIPRLDDLRVAAHEQLIDAKLALGGHGEVIGPLQALIDEHPYRERLRAQLMLALYRSDRQADALQAFQEARRTLIEELGIEPSKRLRELEHAILVQDAVLHLPAQRAAALEPALETARSGFVGRGPELAELVDGLSDASAGRGRLFLLSGEPGIGKSRLAEELLATARARGALVFVGRCWEAGGAPAYWPWVQALRPYLRGGDAQSLRSQLRDGAADVARLFPELRELLVDLPPVAPPESEGARFRLFDAVTAFLKRIAAARPLVLVLDDLHAADEPSLLLLQFVARELRDSRLLIIGAYRDIDPTLADPLTATLTALAREPVTRTLALAGLCEADVGCFMERTAPGAFAARWAAAVHAETERNPLFVGEIVRLLAAERRLDEPTTTPLAIPRSVSEVIGRRLRHLSGECSRLLTLASVLGREFDLDALASVSGMERGAMLELLDEAMEARVVAELPGVIGGMRFAHALIRDVAYHRLSTSRRLQLHREVGEALEVLVSSEVDQHLAELAHHFFASSAAGGDRQKAIDYARLAGERASRLLAHEEAVRLYRLALAALDSTADDLARCELLLELGEALARSGEMATAKETFARAADVARRIRRPELLAEAAVGYGGRFVFVRSGNDRRLVSLLQDALAMLPDDDSVLRVKLLARLAGALRDLPSPRPVASISSEAVEMARRLNDAGTLAYALDGLYAGITCPQHAAQWRAMGDELVAVAERAGDKERLWAGHQHRLGPLMLVGDLDGVERELQEMQRLTAELRQPSHIWAHSLSHTMLALFAGRFEEAEALIERNRELGQRAQTPDTTYVGARLQQLFVLRREEGRLDELERPSRTTSATSPSGSSSAACWRRSAARPDVARRRAICSTNSRATASRPFRRGRSGCSGPGCSRRSVQASPIVRAPRCCTSCCARTPTATCSTGSRSAPARRRAIWAFWLPRCRAGQMPSATSPLRRAWTEGPAGDPGWRTPSTTTPACSWHVEDRVTAGMPVNSSPAPEPSTSSWGCIRTRRARQRCSGTPRKHAASTRGQRAEELTAQRR